MIRFLPAARQDVIGALDWYLGVSPDLGMRFDTELGHQLDRIAANPHHFPVILSDVRRARLRRFPYSLFFRVLDRGIFVIACFHASRDPRGWVGRLT